MTQSVRVPIMLCGRKYKLLITNMIDRCFGKQGNVRRSLRSAGGRRTRIYHTHTSLSRCRASHVMIGRLLQRRDSCSYPLSILLHTHTRLTRTRPDLRDTEAGGKHIREMKILHEKVFILLFAASLIVSPLLPHNSPPSYGQEKSSNSQYFPYTAPSLLCSQTHFPHSHTPRSLQTTPDPSALQFLFESESLIIP